MIKFDFKSKISIIIVLTILSVILYYFDFGNIANRYISSLINPLLRSSYSVSSSLSDFIYPFLNIQDIQYENQQLKNKVIELAQKNVKLSILQEENKFLKKELNFLDSYKYNYVIARPIGRSLGYQGTMIIIDKGSLDGLIPDLAVTAGEGIIIGKIDKVEANISYVKLLIDNSSKLSALVIGQEEPALGITQGKHNINLTINMLPKNININIGDLVATSGFEANIPSGLIIGKIIKLESEEENFFNQALIEPAIDYKSLRLLTIITPDN